MNVEANKVFFFFFSRPQFIQLTHGLPIFFKTDGDPDPDLLLSALLSNDLLGSYVTGKIPSELGKLQNLENLVLSK